MEKVSTRWLIKRDMPKVFKLQENLQYPWSEEDFLDALIKVNCIGVIAEIKNEFAGYVVYELHKTNFYIVNLAVVESLRRKKVGSQLVGLLQNRLSPDRRLFVSTNLRESDLPTQLFLKNLGFRARLIKNYYENEDSYYFSYKLRT